MYRNSYTVQLNQYSCAEKIFTDFCELHILSLTGLLRGDACYVKGFTCALHHRVYLPLNA